MVVYMTTVFSILVKNRRQSKYYVSTIIFILLKIFLFLVVHVGLVYRSKNNSYCIENS